MPTPSNNQKQWTSSAARPRQQSRENAARNAGFRSEDPEEGEVPDYFTVNLARSLPGMMEVEGNLIRVDESPARVVGALESFGFVGRPKQADDSGMSHDIYVHPLHRMKVIHSYAAGTTGRQAHEVSVHGNL